MNHHALLTLAASDGSEIVLIGGVVIALVAIVFSFVRSMVLGTARERSRREIAAYVAEGTMTAEEGERLIKAGNPPPDE
ncbi:MAG: hypothetical protein KF912_13255 [Phycisphaeraceae bacterium]|nr:hypothetical protein [Phycisphaeraceae bacterium]MBX3368273.1 hypothetical protein [Phycisphaeraceae bacterium]QYK47977.1 MAG: hypothetical protein KF838_14450 [Phycisphaeraceae bacterium]